VKEVADLPHVAYTSNTIYLSVAIDDNCWLTLNLILWPNYIWKGLCL